MFSNRRAVCSHEKDFTRSSPNAICASRKAESCSSRSNCAAISSGFSGFTKMAPVPATSGIAEVLELITGVPQAMASSRGMPKLSRKDLYRKAEAPL